ncbi:MAG: 23S rRNA (guanosine(2251)-2'-O)-methyltransferase RlmB [Proteobacteria bacterium]|nr:23S rRNA (guanosine(2251)-2'-O)-methyltransferase RlmB [Pseudomonadota bacterium]MDE3209064.1 23S rRNA (guanosine(2251)-2'-O)-methyltransferase RlmB [Pseudomonadota bacterium]
MSSSSYYYGFHAVLAVLENRNELVESVYFAEDRQDLRIDEVFALAHARGLQVIPKSRRELDVLVGGASHQGVIVKSRQLNQVNFEQVLEKLSQNSLFLILDGVKDPHNLGACLRTANAFGVAAVIIPQDRAAKMSPVVRKVACGAAEKTPLITVTNLSRTLSILSGEGVYIVGAEAQAPRTLPETIFQGPLAVVMGSEESGLRRLTKEKCHDLVSIPMVGTVESFNVSVATALFLYECVRQRRNQI